SGGKSMRVRRSTNTLRKSMSRASGRRVSSGLITNGPPKWSQHETAPVDQVLPPVEDHDRVDHMVDRLAAVIQRAQTPTRRRRRPSKRHLRSRKYDERLTSAPTSTARQRRSALLLALVISLLLAACTGG